MNTGDALVFLVFATGGAAKNATGTITYAANVHDTTGGKLLLDDLAAAHPSVSKVWADGGYRNSVFNHGAARGVDEVVQRPRTKGFAAAETVDDRADLRLADAAPPPGTGLRSPPSGIEGDDPSGPSPVDRARPGSKHHLIVDGQGVPLAVSLTGGNRNDVTQLLPLLDRSLPWPESSADRVGDTLFADRGSDHDKYRRLLRKRGEPARDRPAGSTARHRLGTCRWVVERTMCATRRSVCIPGSAGRNSEGGSWA
ncbi:transposase [Streptomyces canus]|uniref:transposase n=1 Tax=Streptomyces canus TaxID=58343 RepID=UPI00074AC0E5|nr:hypothetical protein AQI96_10450 [Streptomyces canus]